MAPWRQKDGYLSTDPQFRWRAAPGGANSQAEQDSEVPEEAPGKEPDVGIKGGSCQHMGLSLRQL